MTLDQTITEAVEEAVRRALSPYQERIDRLLTSREREPVTVSEAARRLGLSRRTVQRRIRDGALNVVRTGRSIRVVLGGDHGATT